MRQFGGGYDEGAPENQIAHQKLKMHLPRYHAKRSPLDDAYRVMKTVYSNYYNWAPVGGADGQFSTFGVKGKWSQLGLFVERNWLVIRTKCLVPHWIHKDKIPTLW
jgi:hypothetical protein